MSGITTTKIRTHTFDKKACTTTKSQDLQNLLNDTQSMNIYEVSSLIGTVKNGVVGSSTNVKAIGNDGIIARLTANNGSFFQKVFTRGATYTLFALCVIHDIKSGKTDHQNLTTRQEKVDFVNKKLKDLEHNDVLPTAADGKLKFDEEKYFDDCTYSNDEIKIIGGGYDVTFAKSQSQPPQQATYKAPIHSTVNTQQPTAATSQQLSVEVFSTTTVANVNGFPPPGTEIFQIITIKQATEMVVFTTPKEGTTTHPCIFRATKNGAYWKWTAQLLPQGNLTSVFHLNHDGNEVLYATINNTTYQCAITTESTNLRWTDVASDSISQQQNQPSANAKSVAKTEIDTYKNLPPNISARTHGIKLDNGKMIVLLGTDKNMAVSSDNGTNWSVCGIH